MATPHVAGAYAVLRERDPDATVGRTLAALRTTGVPVYDPNSERTRPRIQVDAALGECISATGLDYVTITSHEDLQQVSAGPHTFTSEVVDDSGQGIDVFYTVGTQEVLYFTEGPPYEINVALNVPGPIEITVEAWDGCWRATETITLIVTP